MKERAETGRFFRVKNLDILTYLLHCGFKPSGAPVQDSFGTRWAVFIDTAELQKEIHSFLNGNKAAALLEEFRRARSFLLDSMPTKEKRTDDERQYVSTQSRI